MKESRRARPGRKSAGPGENRTASRRERTAQRREERRGNSQILLLTYAIVAVFLCMAGYLVYFMVSESGEVINNPYNKRQEALAKKIQKGKILSADGKVLAETHTDKNGKDQRVYPYGKVFCHVVGRESNSMTGIEREYCYPLLTSHINPLEQLANTFRGEKSPGDQVVTTLNAELQQAAYDALGDHRGAVVAMEPSTGKILAMVSKPAYDPNTVEENWEKLVNESQKNSRLLNRASQGLYPPGSTFKILTAAEYMLENPETYDDFSYRCKGTDSFSGNVINCYGKERHGKEDLQSAFAQSCNGAFAKMGTELELSQFRKLAERFYFNRELPVNFANNKSTFSLDKEADLGEVTQTAIGQGKTMITPLENCIIASSIANDGELMVPYLVDRLETESGRMVAENKPKSKGRVIDEWVTKKMNRLMKSVVREGTGASLASLPVQVAGKTGSAEFDSEGTSHAWFVGYAPADDPKIAVSILVEGAGTGSQYAVPIAKKMLEDYLAD